MLDQATQKLRPGKRTRARVAGLIPVPAEPIADDMQTAPTERQTLIQAAARRLLHDAQEAGAAWVARLGQPSSRLEARAQWEAHAATVALYRYRYEITGPTPLGDAKTITSSDQAAEYRAAQVALRGPTEILPRCRIELLVDQTLGSASERLSFLGTLFATFVVWRWVEGLRPVDVGPASIIGTPDQARNLKVERGDSMSVLTKQFKDALSKIEPGEDAEHAAEAHAEVRDVLDGHADLVEWGLHTVLIGSYRRDVSIRRVKDVDVFCELPNLPDDEDPQDLLDKFANLLEGEYGDRVTKNDRSVKVDFPDFDMHVDVVPARPADDEWEIPDRDGGWEKTHPVKFSELTTARNQEHDDKYVPVVKLVRQTRRALRGDVKPGGFFVEVAAYHAFADIPGGSSDESPSSTAEYYTVALEKMAPILRDHADDVARLMNPAIPDQELHIRATQEELDTIADEWEEAAVDAREALKSENDQDAARTFKRLLGQNSDGDDVFEVPVAVSAGHRSLPSGESPTFG